MSSIEPAAPTTAVPSVFGLNAGLALGELRRFGQRSDLLLAIAVMGIIVLLIVPLPAMALDLMLAVSITLSVLILLTSLFIEAPLEFSAFC